MKKYIILLVLFYKFTSVYSQTNLNLENAQSAILGTSGYDPFENYHIQNLLNGLSSVFYMEM